MNRRFVPLALLLLGVTAALVFSTAHKPARSVALASAAAHADTVLLLVGDFRPGDRDGSGRAEVFRLADGRMFVRLSGLTTSSGNDVRLYLLGAAKVGSARDLDRVGFVDLGPLRLADADHVYLIPENTPLSRVRAVAVWERGGNINFTSAELRRP